ncbi:MAG TPA: oxidoreductase, partial [Ktedonobacteraceae bacterium]|nr:oxidoreductase [Ktedonobacteraceae bacterium]
MKQIDYLLDRVTMYRLVLYLLLALLGIATLLAFFHLLHFPPLALVASSIFLMIICWAMNTIFAFVLKVPINVESAFITALILALMLDPTQTPGGLLFPGWVAILAMSSKYLLAIRKKHLFNPAAIAVVVTAFAMGGTASWWIGTTYMLPVVLLGGWLMTRKLRQEDMVLLFCVAALLTTCLLSIFQGKAIAGELSQLLLQSPLFFFASIMLTEPLTAPPTRNLRRWYALLTGVLFVPLLHFGSFYLTPELA